MPRKERGDRLSPASDFEASPFQYVDKCRRRHKDGPGSGLSATREVLACRDFDVRALVFWKALELLGKAGVLFVTCFDQFEELGDQTRQLGLQLVHP